MRNALALALLVLLPGCMVDERPTEPDADRDFLPDRAEIDGWQLTVRRVPAKCELPPAQIREEHYFNVTSDELEPDTDFDGVNDREEFVLRGHPRQNDTDGDGLTDKEERDIIFEGDFERSGNLRLWDVDSDSDCLTDFEELKGFLVAGLGIRTSLPTAADTDRDGWNDGFERNVTRTDPASADTDADGAADKLDVDPLRNIAINLTFHRLLVKTSAQGNEFDVRFVYGMDGPRGSHVQPAADAPAFHVVVGANATVPAAHSAGVRDVEDATASDYVPLEFYVQRTDGQGLVDVAPGNETIVHARLYPKRGEWVAGGVTFAAGAVGVLETVEARLEVTIRSATA